MSANLNGHTASNFTHASEERKSTVCKLNGLISDTNNFFLQQSFCLLRVWSKVEICKENLILMEEIILGLQRLFDLYNHFRSIKYFFGCVQNGSCLLYTSTKSPPAAVLLKKACNIEKGSGVPQKDKVAKISKDEVRKIAEMKMKDLNASSIEAAMSMIAGTARSMGIVVEEG